MPLPPYQTPSAARIVRRWPARRPGDADLRASKLQQRHPWPCLQRPRAGSGRAAGLGGRQRRLESRRANCRRLSGGELPWHSTAAGFGLRSPPRRRLCGRGRPHPRFENTRLHTDKAWKWFPTSLPIGSPRSPGVGNRIRTWVFGGCLVGGARRVVTSAGLRVDPDPVQRAACGQQRSRGRAQLVLTFRRHGGNIPSALFWGGFSSRARWHAHFEG